MYALFDRLAAWRVGRALLRVLRVQPRHGGYRVRWNQLDLDDPDRPRLTCSVTELKPLREHD